MIRPRQLLSLSSSSPILWISLICLSPLAGCGTNPIEQGNEDLAMVPDLLVVPDGRMVPDLLTAAPDMTGPTTCAGKMPMPSGTTTRMIMSSGKQRMYLLHVPPGYDPQKPTQLLVDLHGFSDTAAGHLKESGMDVHSDERNFLLVAPQGTGGALASWNAGSCCAPATTNKVEDVVFIGDILAEVRGGFCVDDGRVYVSGFSNGAFFTNRLGCDLADQFAAIAPVSGGVLVSPCKTVRPISVMYFHGTGDLVVPYDGSALLGFPSAKSTFEGWAMRDGCTGMPIQTFMHGKASCQTYGPCKEATEVTLCTIQGGSHSWPGSSGGSMDIDASNQMLDFFAKHVRPTM